MSFTEVYYFRVILFNLFVKFNLKIKLNFFLLLRDFTPNCLLHNIVSSKKGSVFELSNMVKEVFFYFFPLNQLIFFKRNKFNSSLFNFFLKNYKISLFNFYYVFIFLDNFLIKFLPELLGKDLYFKIKFLNVKSLAFTFKDFYDLSFYKSVHDYYEWDIYITYVFLLPSLKSFLWARTVLKQNFIKKFNKILLSEFKFIT